MKHCSKCGENKPLDEFRRNKSASDGRDHYCRDCRNAYTDKWREENREEWLEWRRKYRRKYREAWTEIIEGVFGEVRCMICGFSEHPEVLEWHHLAGKEEQPNRIFSRKPTRARVMEIASCIPLCPTCHRLVHLGKIVVPAESFES